MLDEGEQGLKRNTDDGEMDNEEDSIDEAFHTEYTGRYPNLRLFTIIYVFT